jgi:hypothetical protein
MDSAEEPQLAKDQHQERPSKPPSPRIKIVCTPFVGDICWAVFRQADGVSKNGGLFSKIRSAD